MESLTVTRVDGTEIVLSFPNLDLNDRVKITVKGRNGQVLHRAVHDYNEANGQVLHQEVHDHLDGHGGAEPPAYYSVFPPRFDPPPPNRPPPFRASADRPAEGSSSDRPAERSFFRSLLTLPAGILRLHNKISDTVLESLWSFMIGRSCARAARATVIVVPRAQYISTLFLVEQIHFLTHLLTALSYFAIGFVCQQPAKAMGILIAKWLVDSAYLVLFALFKYLGGPQQFEYLANTRLIACLLRPIRWLWKRPQVRLSYDITFATIYMAMLDRFVTLFMRVPPNEWLGGHALPSPPFDPNLADYNLWGIVPRYHQE